MKRKAPRPRNSGLAAERWAQDQGFAAFLNRVFDHPVGPSGRYDEIGSNVGRMPPERVVQHLTRLFRDPTPGLEPFSPAQIAQGLWCLLDNPCSNAMLPLVGLEVSWEARRECIRAIPRLFSTLFAPRCSAGLSHLGEAGENPMNGIYYMWWDCLPTHGRANEAAYAARDREFLGAMEQILSLRSIACQESALHGLGHWHSQYPAPVEAAVDGFLQEHPYVRSELHRYAENARMGCVQ